MNQVQVISYMEKESMLVKIYVYNIDDSINVSHGHGQLPMPCTVLLV